MRQFQFKFEPQQNQWFILNPPCKNIVYNDSELVALFLYSFILINVVCNINFWKLSPKVYEYAKSRNIITKFVRHEFYISLFLIIFTI